MSELDDTFTIRVNIADRYYPLKIKRSDESKVRNAAKRINDTVFQYKKVYSDKDAQDFMAMAALQFVTRLTEFEENQNGDKYLDFLEEVSQRIDTALEKQ
ncbi:MAG: cell division protein ZapA [Salinivirgaceae bacterium]